MKDNGEKISMLTSYDFTSAGIVDKAGIDVVRQAVYYNWPVSFPPWEDVKDCADAVNKYGRPFTLKSILDFVETNKTKIKVRSQLWKYPILGKKLIQLKIIITHYQG